MKFLKIILKILLPILLILITMSFSVESTIVKTISDDIMAKRVSGYILDEIIDDYNVDELGEIQDNIRSSKYIEKITSKYIDLVLDIVENKNSKIDIAKEINLIIENILPEDITQSQEVAIYANLQNQSLYIADVLESNIPSNYGSVFIFILKVYDIFTNIIFRIITIVLLLIDILLLVILEKYKSLKSFEIGTIITAIFSIIILITIKLSSRFIEQRLSGGWIDNININLLLYFTIAEIIISIILYITRKQLNKNMNKSDVI